MPHLRASLGKVWTLLFSVCIFVLGHGLQGTLLSVRAGKEEMSDQIVGLMVSAYFLGYLASSLVSPRLVRQAGHIRTFAALTSIASAVSLMHILSPGRKNMFFSPRQLMSFSKWTCPEAGQSPARRRRRRRMMPGSSS